MIKLAQISSLENILPKKEQEFTSISGLCVLKGERASYQIAFCKDNSAQYETSLVYNINFESSIREHLKIYRVECVPVNRTVFCNKALLEDDNYISTEPGLYPDILRPFDGNTILSQPYYQGIWIEIDDKVPAGAHEIKVTLSNDYESVSTSMKLEVLDLKLPRQELVYGLPVHADCIASYYNIEVFSEKHWELLEKFIRISAEYGSNMVVPPIFTPPVDTQVGGERLTVQLVEMYKDGDKYSFDFSKFERYVDICHNAGIKYFYMPQFFTQWGAEFTPKIIVHENGEEKRIFGWDVKSTDDKYLGFLRQFIPELLNNIKEQGIEKNVMFSISDEPSNDETVARYKELYGFLKTYLDDYKIVDAFPNYEHYKQCGAVVTPLIPTNKVKDFKETVSELCVYYCCGQDFLVSNRLMAMPSYRNRSFGYQLYKYDVKLFFHWALNFYNSQLSLRPINPFYVTDADGGFPAGDTYSVYPGENGPIPSMRFIVFYEALQDFGVLNLLESYIGRDAVTQIIESVTGEVTFENCAKSSKTILNLREKVMSELRKYAG